MTESPDPHDLDRFVSAQAGVHERALRELRSGRKRSHWMWFVFPQIAGLGRSSTARRFAIRSADEARAYLAHPTLGPRLIEAADTVRAAHRDDPTLDATALMGSPDDLKLRSSMTLFAEVADDPTPFQAVLDAYYDGVADPRTLEILGRP